MTGVERTEALVRWDAEIFAAYTARTAGSTSALLRECDVTLRDSYARELIVVAGDVAARSSEHLGRSTTTIDHRVLRDASVGVVVTRYVSVLPRADRKSERGSIGERIMLGLIHRREPRLHGSLVGLTMALPARAVRQLDDAVSRVFGETDLADLDGWPGDLAIDVRSSVIEAVVAEWMHHRSLAFGIRIGRDPDLDQLPNRRSRRPRGQHAR